jgi:hypothetical protein
MITDAVGTAWAVRSCAPVPTEPPPITLAQVVRRAAEIVDPDDDDVLIGEFELAFEDADEPVSTVGDLEERVADVLSELDPAVASGSLSMAGALTVYLGYRRDELRGRSAELLRLAARAEWAGDPPGAVRDWLADRGVPA